MKIQKINQLAECRHEYVERYIKKNSIPVFGYEKVLFVYGAYLIKEQDSTGVDLDSLELFSDGVSETLLDLKSSMESMAQEFDKDTLLSYILFGKNYRDEYASDETPISIMNMVLDILDLKPNDNVLDFCSGEGNSMLQLYLNEPDAHYTGMEIIIKNTQISNLKSMIIEADWQQVTDDVCHQVGEHQYNKIFANYPFLLNPSLDDNVLERLTTFTGIESKKLAKVSTDWIFNLLVLEHLALEGKAVVLTSPRAVRGNLNSEVIEFFVKNGYLETVISLPERMFNNTMIPVNLMVLSHGNTTVNMIDATEFGHKERLNRIFSTNDIEKICTAIGEDSEYSKVVDFDEIESRNYDLIPVKYLNVLPEFEDGKTIGEISTNLKRGAQLKASELEDLQSNVPTTYRYLNLSDLEDGYVVDNNHYLEYIPEKLEKYCITTEGIVISKTGKPYFKSAYIKAEPGEKILVTGNMYIIEFDEEVVNPAYLAAFLVSEVGKASIQSVGGGNITLPTIPIKELKEMIVPIPDKASQDIIALNYCTIVTEMQMMKKMYEDKKEALTKVYQ